jgi:hypothetical protein
VRPAAGTAHYFRPDGAAKDAISFYRRGATCKVGSGSFDQQADGFSDMLWQFVPGLGDAGQIRVGDVRRILRRLVVR